MSKINTIQPQHNLFQQRLNSIADPPIKLYYNGVLYGFEAPVVAIVGSRKYTPYGKEVTYKIAYDLAKQGVTIMSGLALGIDSIAHQAALDAGGTTIAILPCGIERIYPFRHRALAAKIVENGGALISEYPETMPPLKHQFIARNRIVAALCDGLLVTEAAHKSGTLHTANFALDIGKTIMAVPGAITNPVAAGTNRLIQTGAALVTNAEEVLFAIGYSNTAKVITNQQLTLIAESPEEEAILALLRQGIREGEELHSKSGLEIAAFNQTLTMMEITGKVRPLGSGHWTLN